MSMHWRDDWVCQPRCPRACCMRVNLMCQLATSKDIFSDWLCCEGMEWWAGIRMVVSSHLRSCVMIAWRKWKDSTVSPEEIHRVTGALGQVTFSNPLTPLWFVHTRSACQSSPYQCIQRQILIFTKLYLVVWMALLHTCLPSWCMLIKALSRYRALQSL